MKNLITPSLCVINENYQSTLLLFVENNTDTIWAISAYHAVRTIARYDLISCSLGGRRLVEGKDTTRMGKRQSIVR